MTILPLPAFNDNYIWAILHKSNNEMWVVDPGDAKVVMDFLQQNNKKLIGILITHHHFDHTGGVKELKEYAKCPVYGPHHLTELVTHPVSNTDPISIFDRSFETIETPAHTLDHLCYFSNTHSDPMLFSGDTLFRGGCGRLMEGSAAQMLTAMNRLKALPDDTKVYCTHEYTLSNYRFALSLEPDNQVLIEADTHCQNLRKQNTPTLPSTLRLEKACNPFMRTDNRSLLARAAQQINEPISTDNSQQFAQVRRAKDAFS
ncbi:hydroxyacylglutathione hydrolase [Marinomonas sp. 2405UD68-3]|uniref:hydroxyacylglutathione hydrolase n=1 Tax=Marinomonas sp. 2405UD68-3 TaxID=3391835 RepID=UPI0039C9F37A